ncbi:MAG: NAD(P)-dependent oxidoreductase [Myxococcales bacterium]|nr:NAD(P)-dependent oxidoreductase [Myxococcales bacterium]
MGKKVAFIGLGVMGAPMAGHLARAGHEVSVFNRTRAKAEAWVEQHGGRARMTPAEAAEGAQLIFCCVGNDDHLAAVTLGREGVLESIEDNAVLVDHTTASADIARELARRALAKNAGFLDAPVSGGQAGAEHGTLTVMVGGRESDYEQARPLIEHYARHARLLGPTGSGQLAKMVNQICIAGLLQGLSEGLHFAEQAGLDPESVIDVISKGAAQSWQMDNRYQTMLEGRFDFGFAVDWMRKDLALALQEARGNGAQLPVTALVDQLYAEIQAMGGNRWDTSSLIERLRGLTEGGSMRP